MLKAVLFAFALLLPTACTTIHYPAKPAPKAEHHQSYNYGQAVARFVGIIESPFVGLGDAVFEHRDVINALSTFVIGAFTVALFIATNGQLRHLRREFNATHRSFIAVDFKYELVTAADRKWIDGWRPPPLRNPIFTDHEDLFVTRFAVQTRWKNSGGSAAKIVTKTHWSPPGGDPIRYSYPNAEERYLVMPNSEEGSEFSEMPGASAVMRSALLFENPGPRMFVYGIARVKDEVSAPRWLTWCYLVRFENHAGEKLRVSFIQWGPYNQSGDGEGPDEDGLSDPSIG